MKCPRCENSLSLLKVNDVELDVCQNACGGIWFDKWELQKLDEHHEVDVSVFSQIKCNHNIQVDMEKRLDCPKCDRKIVMMRHFHSVKRRVEVDECPGCGGYWLDLGELVMIHENYSSDSERKAAHKKLFDDLFGDQLKQMSDERREKAKKASSIYEFLNPGTFKL
ncbi:MAG: zf-TFIIB domain-containing protein [Oligoflexales bacterium]